MTRRNALLAAVGGGSLLALSVTNAQAKMAQTSAGYQQMPNGEKQCDGCNFYLTPNACKLVDGEIIPTGYCKFWAKKPAS